MVASVALVANGDLINPVLMAKSVQMHDYVIAVDGGLTHCHSMNIQPNLILGDFDSADPQLLEKYKHIPSITYPKNKDLTDLELAIQEAQKLNAQWITLFCALGKRADHALFNLNILGRFPGKLRIETESETVYAICDNVELVCIPGETLSFLPIGETAEGITTHGLKWDMHNAEINKDFMSISNVALSSHVKIMIRKGVLLCCRVKG